MPIIIKTVIAFALFTIGFSGNVLLQEPPLGAVDPVTAPYGPYQSFVAMQKDIYLYVASSTTSTIPQPVYKHGECDWLPALALKAGWPVDQLGKVKQAALRESGCCFKRLGGDRVDKDCNITGVSEWNHRSDTGLLQINGINWDLSRNPNAPICLQMKICTQEPLLDAFINLRAGLVLYNYWEKAAGNGWIPWDICNRTKTCK